MITNSAVRAHQDSFRSARRSSATAPRSSLVRQVERICDEDEPAVAARLDSASSLSSDDDVNDVSESSARPSLAKLKKSSRDTLKPQRQRRASLRGARYSIARRLKAREENDISESNDGQGEVPWNASTSEQSATAAGIPTTISHNNELTSVSASERDTSLRRSKKPWRRKSSAYIDVKSERPWYILLPHSKLRMGWDIFMAWLLAFMAFYIPFRVCMYWDDDNPISPGVFWFELVTDVTFGIDIALNFLTAYQDTQTKKFITAPKLIAIKYLKGFFLLDVIATFPFSYILSNSSIGIANKVGKLGRLPKIIKFLRAIRLLKLLRMYKLQQFIMKLEVEYNIHHGISRMLNIVTLVMLVTHFVGCFWYLVGLSGGPDLVDGGWIYRFDFDDRSIPSKYVASLYWAFSTLTTVGYGDISARTPQEQMYSMAMMLLGVSWYAYVVSSMSSIMSTFDAQNKAVRDKLICVNEFVRAARLPPCMARRVRDYFDHKLANSQRAFLMSKHYDADELLEELSSGLRADVFLFMERDLVKKIPFFDNKVPQFIADTISMFQPMMFQEGDFIVKEGTQADEMFFLTKGRAAVYIGDWVKTEINEGGYFGEIGCIMGGIRRAGIKALVTCELQALSRRNLNILLGEYPDVAEELKNVAKYRAQVVRQDNKQRGRHSPCEDSSSSSKDKVGEGLGGEKEKGGNILPSTCASMTTTSETERSIGRSRSGSSSVAETCGNGETMTTTTSKHHIDDENSDEDGSPTETRATGSASDEDAAATIEPQQQSDSVVSRRTEVSREPPPLSLDEGGGRDCLGTSTSKSRETEVRAKASTLPQQDNEVQFVDAAAMMEALERKVQLHARDTWDGFLEDAEAAASALE